MPLHDLVVSRLARIEQPAHQGFTAGAIAPVLMQMDGRDLNKGDVFLWDGAEHTVEDIHEARISRRLFVTTNKGAKILFTLESEPVTIVL